MEYYEIELAECPFCGQAVKMKQHPALQGVGSGTMTYSIGNPTYSITCDTDGCFLKSGRCYESPEQLAKEWNTRSNVTVVKKIMADIDEALSKHI